MTVHVDDAVVRRAVQALRSANLSADEARSIANTLETALPDDGGNNERTSYTAEDLLQLPHQERRRIMAAQLARGAACWESDEPSEAQIALGILYDAETHQPTEAPAWLAGIQPQDPAGWRDLDRRLGPWPGNETDAEIQEALERMS